MRLIQLLIWLLFASSVIAQTDSELFEQLFEHQRYAEALNIFNDHDSTIANLTKKATCEYRLGLLKPARVTYHRIYEKDTSNITAISQLGSIYNQQYDLPKAIKFYRKLIQLDSENSYYYKINAQVALKARLKSEAFKYYAKAYQLNPRDITVMRELSDLFLSNKQNAEADSMLNLAYLEDSTNLQTILSKAKMEYTKKDYTETVRLLLKTKGRLDLSPYYVKMLGYSFLQIDSFDIAISHLEKLLHEESNEYTHYYLATAYSKKENWERAIYHFDLAIKDAVSPNLFIYHANLGDIYVDDNQRKKALKHYEEAYRYKEDPKYLFFRARLSDEYYKDKQIAINLYNRYVKSNDFRKEWMDYSKQRIRYLKEYRHQASNK